MSAALFIPTVFAGLVLWHVAASPPRIPTEFAKALSIVSAYWLATMFLYGTAYALGLVS